MKTNRINFQVYKVYDKMKIIILAS